MNTVDFLSFFWVSSPQPSIIICLVYPFRSFSESPIPSFPSLAQDSFVQPDECILYIALSSFIKFFMHSVGYTPQKEDTGKEQHLKIEEKEKLVKERMRGE